MRGIMLDKRDYWMCVGHGRIQSHAERGTESEKRRDVHFVSFPRSAWERVNEECESEKKDEKYW